MALDEYLEKLAAEGYRQQLADEENVPRSLPFFAASLAVLVAILGAIKDWIPAPSSSAYPLVIWALLGVLAFTILVIMYFLREAVRKRDFKYVMNEHKVAKYAEDLRLFYEPDASLTAEACEAAILADIQAELARQYRDAAVNNRALNFRRASARSTAFEVLVFALLLAFAIIAIILWQHNRTGERDVGSVQGHDRGTAQARDLYGRPGSRTSQARPATDANHQEGRLDVPGTPPDAGQTQGEVTATPPRPETPGSAPK
jgi:protein-S-isoprenylcysteine O-methyltransferase Ste14